MNDARSMRRALELAEARRTSTILYPKVARVIVQERRVIGERFRREALAEDLRA